MSQRRHGQPCSGSALSHSSLLHLREHEPRLSPGNRQSSDSPRNKRLVNSSNPSGTMIPSWPTPTASAFGFAYIGQSGEAGPESLPIIVSMIHFFIKHNVLTRIRFSHCASRMTHKFNPTNQQLLDYLCFLIKRQNLGLYISARSKDLLSSFSIHWSSAINDFTKLWCLISARKLGESETPP
jgi:hypothetical protein